MPFLSDNRAHIIVPERVFWRVSCSVCFSGISTHTDL